MDVDQDTTASTASTPSLASLTVTLNGLQFSDNTGTFQMTPGVDSGTFMLTPDGVVMAVEDETEREPWEGPLAVEGHPTADGRVLLRGEVEHRDLPVPLMVQEAAIGGHDGATVAGRIETIEWIPADEFSHPDYDFSDLREGAVVIWATGTFDDSEHADEAKRMIENGAGVSIDMPTTRLAWLDPETLEEIADEDVSLDDIFGGNMLMGMAGKIAGATIVTVPAFEEAEVKVDRSPLVSCAAMWREHGTFTSYVDFVDFGLRYADRMPAPLVAAAVAPLHPPRSWFDDPRLNRLTPLTITEDGRVFGHLADWNGCHTGFGDVCVPPFRSFSNYAYFNTGEIETAEGDLIPCGKLMFSMDGKQHAPLNPRLSAQEISRYYDDATKVGGYVRAGTDRFGTWLAGTLRPGLSDKEIQHLRLHPPSGDWRPIPGKPGSELVAAFCVPVPGFPIARSLVASGADGELMIITGPLSIEPGEKQIIRRRAMLRARLAETLQR